MPITGPATDRIEIRAVRDDSELRRAFATIAPLFAAPVDPDHDFRLEVLLKHFAADRELMLIAVDTDQIGGAALGYRATTASVKLQAIAVLPELRRSGVGTRLVGELEQRSRQLGSTSIHLGAEESARPFYAALGYQGKRSVLSKSLPGAALAGSSLARQERLAALRAARDRRRERQVEHDDGG